MSATTYRPVSARQFARTVREARKASPLHAENITPHPSTHYTGATYLATDGHSGYAVQADGELVSVYSTVRSRGWELVQHAVNNGARYLDCFEGHLSELYAQHGFVESQRMANWDGTGPDVLIMARKGSTLERITGGRVIDTGGNCEAVRVPATGVAFYLVTDGNLGTEFEADYAQPVVTFHTDDSDEGTVILDAIHGWTADLASKINSSIAAHKRDAA